jgi:hypothetical protein
MESEDTNRSNYRINPSFVQRYDISDVDDDREEIKDGSEYYQQMDRIFDDKTQDHYKHAILKSTFAK